MSKHNEEEDEGEEIEIHEADDVETLEKYRAKMSSISSSNIQLIQKIGAGVFGAVFRCKVTGLEGLKFVVKINIKGDQETEFFQDLGERENMKVPFHPNVVTILGFLSEFKIPDNLSEVKGVNEDFLVDVAHFIGVTINRPSVIMKYYDYDLLKYLNEVRTISTNEFVSLLEDIMEGANHLNKRYIVHLDLHEENVFISRNTKSGTVSALIGDFGASLDLGNNFSGFLVNVREWEKFCVFSGSKKTLSEVRKIGEGRGPHLAPEVRSYFSKEEDGGELKKKILNRGKFDLSKCDVYSVGYLGLDETIPFFFN